MRFLDARVPVVIAERPETAGDLLFEVPESEATGHADGCACCLPRTAAARALTALFTDRARGRVRWFDRVVACCPTASAEAALHAALAEDPLAAAWFRWAGGRPRR